MTCSRRRLGRSGSHTPTRSRGRSAHMTSTTTVTCHVSAAPALLLVGGESPVAELVHARTLAAALPSARVSVLPGQGHVAPVTAPELVAREIVAFADAPSPSF